MLKFNKVLLASDFDNTLVYTQGALERGEDIPPMSARNREAVEYFIQNGGYFSISTGPRAARLCPLRQGSALQRPPRHRQRRGHL